MPNKTRVESNGANSVLDWKSICLVEYLENNISIPESGLLV